MAKIAIVKLRTQHDVEFTVGPWSRLALWTLGAGTALSKLKAIEGKTVLPQLTLPYLAGIVDLYNQRTGHRHECVLIDELEAGIREQLLRLGPFDMVWLTTSTHSAPALYRISRELTDAGTITVLGGIHATMRPAEASHFANSVATGEGEITVAQLLTDFDAEGRLRPLYEGHRTKSLVGLAKPRWDLLGYPPVVQPVQTSRGCRNGCSFCSTTGFQGTRRRHRPVQEVVDEITKLQDEGLDASIIFFTDNNIVSDSDHRRGIIDNTYARELFAALEPLKIEWAGQGEINLADDPELVELAARSGCRVLLVGFETLDQKNLDSVNKPSNDVARYVEQIRVLRSWGIALIGCFVFGFDHDTPASFGQTADFITRHVDIPQLSVLTPFPGTALYKKLAKEGRLLHHDLSRYDVLNVVHQPGGLSPVELRDGFVRASRQVFATRHCIARAARFASAVRYGPAAKDSWVEHFTRTLAPNLYYRAELLNHAPTIEASSSGELVYAPVGTKTDSSQVGWRDVG